MKKKYSKEDIKLTFNPTQAKRLTLFLRRTTNFGENSSSQNPARPQRQVIITLIFVFHVIIGVFYIFVFHVIIGVFQMFDGQFLLFVDYLTMIRPQV